LSAPGIPQQGEDRRGHLRRAVRIDESGTVGGDLRQAGAAAGDDRRAQSHPFEHRQPEALGTGDHHGGQSAPVEGEQHRIVNVAHEPYGFADAEASRVGPDRS